jgi:tRNA pseudouridine38-40 synthase
MVRIMAGTLVGVGQGVLAAESIPDMIMAGDRKKAGITAPPQGLCLMEVFY